MIDITLHKLKYRNPNRVLRMDPRLDPPNGTWLFKAGPFKSKSCNQGGLNREVSTLRPRRKAYGPF